MEIRRKGCSTADEYMNNYFTSFPLLTHLEVNNIHGTGVLNKYSLRKCTIIGVKQVQKRDMVNLNNAHQAKKWSSFDSGCNNIKVAYIASFKSSEPKRFVRHLNKVERKHIQEHQPN